jgi:hypothetical protein
MRRCVGLLRKILRPFDTREEPTCDSGTRPEVRETRLQEAERRTETIERRSDTIERRLAAIDADRWALRRLRDNGQHERGSE